MVDRIRVLLQTSITPIEDDWNIGRFSLLRECIAGLTPTDADVRFEVALDPALRA